MTDPSTVAQDTFCIRRTSCESHNGREDVVGKCSTPQIHLFPKKIGDGNDEETIAVHASLFQLSADSVTALSDTTSAVSHARTTFSADDVRPAAGRMLSSVDELPMPTATASTSSCGAHVRINKENPTRIANASFSTPPLAPFRHRASGSAASSTHDDVVESESSAVVPVSTMPCLTPPIGPADSIPLSSYDPLTYANNTDTSIVGSYRGIEAFATYRPPQCVPASHAPPRGMIPAGIYSKFGFKGKFTMTHPSRPYGADPLAASALPNSDSRALPPPSWEEDATRGGVVVDAAAAASSHERERTRAAMWSSITDCHNNRPIVQTVSSTQIRSRDDVTVLTH